MKRQARAQNLDMVSQLQWRFRKYGALMFRMMCLVHPLFDEEDGSYHGLRWGHDLPETLKPIAFILRLRTVLNSD